MLRHHLKFVSGMILLTAFAAYAQEVSPPKLPPYVLKSVEEATWGCYSFDSMKQVKLFENTCQKNSEQLDAALKEIDKYKQAITALQDSNAKLTNAQAKTWSLYYSTEQQLEQNMKDKAQAEAHSIWGGGFYILVIGVLGGAVAGFVAAKKL